MEDIVQLLQPVVVNWKWLSVVQGIWSTLVFYWFTCIKKNQNKKTIGLYQISFCCVLYERSVVYSGCNKFYISTIWPLFTLSHRGSDYFPLQIMFKWTLFELCLCIYYVMISTNQIAYFKPSAVFLKMTKSFSLLSVALHHDFDQSDSIRYFKRSALFLKMTKWFSPFSVA